jgi:transposase
VSQPKARFYDELFIHLDLSCVTHAKTGRKSQKEALLCSFILMKLERFSQITDLHDYLSNNLLIAHYCGFDITKPLPSYWTFDRFIRNLDNRILKEIMQTQVLKLAELGIIDTSFVGLDSTPIMANTNQNNPKSFAKNKHNPENQPRADKDCRLGVRTASNQHNEKNYEFYWGYKNHVLSDCITGLPIYELTTPANVADCTVALDILAVTHSFLPITECSFIADKAYDVKDIYNTVKDVYQGECFIPLNQRNTKNLKLLPVGYPLCEADLMMIKDGKDRSRNRLRQKFSCPFKKSDDDTACPCNHSKYVRTPGKKSRGCVKKITIPDDYRLSIDRQSVEFKSVYALRTECERYNSRFKSTGQERLWVRNGNSVANLNTIAHISLLAIAIAAVVTQSKVSYRCLKSVKRVA